MNKGDRYRSSCGDIFTIVIPKTNDVLINHLPTSLIEYEDGLRYYCPIKEIEDDCVKLKKEKQ